MGGSRGGGGQKTRVALIVPGPQREKDAVGTDRSSADSVPPCMQTRRLRTNPQMIT